MTTTKHSNIRARAGDWLDVNGLPGYEPRCGQVVEVLGREGQEHYRVRWDEQHESIFYPTQETAVIRRLRPKGARR
jgi:hypothetical protein